MVHSPNYERLKEFMSAAQVNGGLTAWETDHARTMQGFQDAIERLAFYRANHGFTGAAADAMDSWVTRAIDRIEGYRDFYKQGYETYESARDAMATALQEAQTISPDLLDAETAAMRDDWVVEIPENSSVSGLKVPIINKKYTTGEAYVSAVEEQNNAQREAAAGSVLAAINQKTQFLGNKLGKITITGPVRPIPPVPPVPPPVPDPKPTPGGGGGGGGGGGWRPGGGGGGRSGGGGGGYTPENGFGREGGRNGEGYPGGFDKPWWSEADAAAARNRVIASGAVPTKELPYGELGSRTNPITDPQDLMDTDLLHTRVNGTTYRNGVVGGHTPAPAADSGHPLWRLNGGAAADATTAGRLGGAGVLGAGALGMRGAARMGAGSGFGGLGGASGSAGGMGAGGMGGLRGITGTTGSAGAMGASNLRVGTYSGSGFGSYTPPASVAGANGAAGAGASGVTGTTGTGSGGTAGAAGAAGRGGAGAGGGFMGGGGAGAGAGMGKDDKKGRKRKYVAFTVDEDEDDLPAGYVNPLSQTYGTDRTITPVKREDDGWDLRQW